MVCVLFAFPVLCEVVVVGGAAECIVVRVVVRDPMEGAGEENVLSTPRAAPTVPVVPSPDDGAWECAASVDIVAAIDLLPIVGGDCPSSDDRTECLRRLTDDVLSELPVGTVENDG
jgi:hypothetical protein